MLHDTLFKCRCQENKVNEIYCFLLPLRAKVLTCYMSNLQVFLTTQGNAAFALPHDGIELYNRTEQFALIVMVSMRCVLSKCLRYYTQYLIDLLCLLML